jgi:hypothetical protein
MEGSGRRRVIQTRGVLKKELTAQLRTARMRHPKSHNAKSGQGQILDMVSIRERPAKIEDRAVTGGIRKETFSPERTTRTSPPSSSEHPLHDARQDPPQGHDDGCCCTCQAHRQGARESGRGDAVNMHDILAGSDPQSLYSTAGGDTTCGNWTKSGEGSAIVDHHACSSCVQRSLL